MVEFDVADLGGREAALDEERDVGGVVDDVDVFFFVVTIFLFIVGSGLTGLLPYVGEATQDLNTTFALGISSFCFSQYQGIKAHGLSHFKEFLQPLFLLLPLNVIGELAKAASMSFRLFGNILGGSIMVDLILHFISFALLNDFIRFG